MVSANAAQFHGGRGIANAKNPATPGQRAVPQLP
jgi:hypothetical protein